MKELISKLLNFLRGGWWYDLEFGWEASAFGLERTVILILQLKAALKTEKQTKKQQLKI